MENIRNIIESLLFVSDEPLTVDKLKSVIETVDAKEIRANLNALADQYEARGGGFRLSEVAGGWQLRSRSQYNEYIKRLLQPSPQRLSRPALETLAIVAYNQPIIRADIEHIRGVDCGGMLRQLLERKLIRVLGRKEIPGRPLIYATSKLFLELFELKNLKDLPTPKEIEEITAPTGSALGTPTSTTKDATPAAHAGPADATPSFGVGVTTLEPLGLDTSQSLPVAGSTIPTYGVKAKRSGIATNVTSNSNGATFPSPPKISSVPNKMPSTPNLISAAPFKIAQKNKIKPPPQSPTTCNNGVKNKNESAPQLRAGTPKKP